MVDSGSQPNLIKISDLDRKLRMNILEKPILREISGHDQNSMGVCHVEIYGINSRFVVVDNKFPIAYPLILGSHFFKQSLAIINYDKGQIIFGERVIPFENTKDNEETPVEINNDKDVVTTIEAENGEISVIKDNDSPGIKSRSVRKSRENDYGLSEVEFNRVLLDLISLDLSSEYERSQVGREGSETDGDANSMLCEIGTEAEAQNRDANLFDISTD